MPNPSILCLHPPLLHAAALCLGILGLAGILPSPLQAQTPSPVGLSLKSETGPVDWSVRLPNGTLHACQDCAATGVALPDTTPCRVTAKREGVVLAEQTLPMAPGHQHYVLTREDAHHRLRYRGDEKPLELRLVAPVPAGMATKMASVLTVPPTAPPVAPPTPAAASLPEETLGGQAPTLTSPPNPVAGIAMSPSDPIEPVLPKTESTRASTAEGDPAPSPSIEARPEFPTLSLESLCTLEHQYDRLKAAEAYAHSKTCSPDELKTLLGCLDHDFSKLELLRLLLPTYAQTPGFSELGNTLEYPWTRAAFQETWTEYAPNSSDQPDKP